MSEASSYKDIITARVVGLPHASESHIVDDSEALAVMSVTKYINPSLHQHLFVQIDRVDDAVREYFTEIKEHGCVTLTGDQIRGIIARSAIAGSAQMATDLAETLQDISLANQHFEETA